MSGVMNPGRIGPVASRVVDGDSWHNHAPLVIAPTGTAGLIEFSRTECGHYHRGQCIEHASRDQLTAALRHVETRPTARIGQTVLDESDLRLLAKKLDEYDAALAARRAS